MLLFAAPTLVGIITPLLARVITDLEMLRLKKLEEIREEASRLTKIKRDDELKEIKERIDDLAGRYENIKKVARFLDWSIYLGIFVTGVCAFAIAEIFFYSNVVFINLQVLLAIALAGFVVESFLLLAIVLSHVLLTRKTIVESPPRG
jgi:hypothetical protein